MGDKIYSLRVGKIYSANNIYQVYLHRSLKLQHRLYLNVTRAMSPLKTQ